MSTFLLSGAVRHGTLANGFTALLKLINRVIVRGWEQIWPSGWVWIAIERSVPSPFSLFFFPLLNTVLILYSA